MSIPSPFLVVNSPCPGVIAAITGALKAAGFRVMQTFDFRDTRAAQAGCICPRHGRAPCDCELVVLLVFGSDDLSPVSLVAHGNDGQTWLSIAERTADPLAERMRRDIQRALAQSRLESSLPKT